MADSQFVPMSRDLLHFWCRPILSFPVPSSDFERPSNRAFRWGTWAGHQIHRSKYVVGHILLGMMEGRSLPVSQLYYRGADIPYGHKPGPPENKAREVSKPKSTLGRVPWNADL